MDIYAVKLCVIDDLIDPVALHLLRLTPKAWLKEDYLTRFENVPTVFGPVTVHFQLDSGGKTLKVHFDAEFHHPPKKVILHVPPLHNLQRIYVNGQEFSAAAGDVVIVKPKTE